MKPQQPYNPFSRDEYPALTDAIRGVVNRQSRPVEEDVQTPERAQETRRAATRAYTGQGRPTTPRQRVGLLKRIAKERSSETVYGKGGKPDTAANARRTLTRQSRAGLLETPVVGEEVTPKRMEVLNRAVKTGMSGGLRNAQSRALADRASLAITRAYATKGGKKVTGFDKAKREHEGAKAQHKTLKSTSAGVNEDIQTPAREREMLGKMKRAEARTDAEGKRYMRATGSAFATSKTKAERVKKIRKASKRYNTALSAQDKTYATQRKEEMSRRLYGKGGKLVKRAVKESQELDERIIDGVDAFQAAKNWVGGKGFKTNREVSAAQANKNYAAMKKRQEAEAKKKG